MNGFPLGAFLLVPFVLACFALSPQAQATCQEGCDTVTFNTFLGDDAPVNNTTGSENTAMGGAALLNNLAPAHRRVIGAPLLQPALLKSAKDSGGDIKSEALARCACATSAGS
jgi:hypothetical protein